MRYYINTASHLLDDNDDLRPLKELGSGGSGDVYLVSLTPVPPLLM